MRIVHVANANYKYLGQRNYGLPIKINNGLIRNGHDVYFFSERDVARAASILGARKFGARACNRQLIEVCQNFEPELLVLAHADMITVTTIETIRQRLPDLVVFQYNIDGLFIPSNVASIRSKSECVDHTFMTTAGASLREVAGSRSGVSFIPNPVDPSIDACRNHERDDLVTDVMFAAAMNKWVAPDDLRALAPDAILKNLPELHCEFYGNENKVWGAEFRRVLCRSKMGLNFSLRPEGLASGKDTQLYLYSSDRICLYMGNGLLTFVSSASNLGELYGDGVVEVGSVDEMIDKLKYFHAHDKDRKQVATKGYHMVHEQFNERLVAQYMIERACNTGLTRNYAWPVEVYYR